MAEFDDAVVIIRGVYLALTGEYVVRFSSFSMLQGKYNKTSEWCALMLSIYIPYLIT